MTTRRSSRPVPFLSISLTMYISVQVVARLRGQEASQRLPEMPIHKLEAKSTTHGTDLHLGARMGIERCEKINAMNFGPESCARIGSVTGSLSYLSSENSFAINSRRSEYDVQQR